MGKVGGRTGVGGGGGRTDIREEEDYMPIGTVLLIVI